MLQLLLYFCIALVIAFEMLNRLSEKYDLYHCRHNQYEE